MKTDAREGHVSKRDICGVEVHCGPPTRWVETIDGKVGREKTRLGYVNSYTAYLLTQDAAFHSVLQRFTLLNDGIGLDILSMIKYGKSFEHNLNGSDFTPFFLQASKHKFSIFVLGGRPGVAERAVEALKRIAPQHRYVGTHHGHLDRRGEQRVADLVRASRANLVIVGFGNPKQEVWIAKHADTIDADLFIAVGALLDFLAGTMPRAPEWMRRVRLEWMHRLMLEPHRLWRRYFVCTPLLLLRALLDACLRRRWLQPAVVAAAMFADINLAECHS